MNERKKHAGGRPKAANPLAIDCKVRFDAETFAELESYCARNGVKKSTAIRQAVRILIESEQPPTE